MKVKKAVRGEGPEDASPGLRGLLLVGFMVELHSSFCASRTRIPE